jgi:undecaprenyl-diphosphatase
MDWWQALVLGIVQGLTEFLPISSSGHLILAQELLGVELANEQLDAFDVALHLGTLVAVFSYFWSDIVRIVRAGAGSLVRRKVETTDERLAWFVALGTIPAIAAYALFGDAIQAAQDNYVLIGSMLIGFCLVFAIADRYCGTGDVDRLTLGRALAIGCGQALALIPGTSRSGATIATGMLVGLDRKAAARFSFLLSTPATLAALVLTSPDLVSGIGGDPSFFVATVVGTVAAGISGYIAIATLLRFLGGHALSWFSLYRIPAGIFILWYYG